MRILIFIPFSLKAPAGNVSRVIESIGLLNELNYDIVLWNIGERGVYWNDKINELNPSISYLESSFPKIIVDKIFRFIYIINTVLVNKIKIIEYHRFDCLRLLSPIIKKIFFNNSFDYVFGNYIWSVELFANLPNIIDIHDLHKNRHKVIGKRVWINLSERYENMLFAKANLLISINFDDLKVLKKSNLNSIYIPYLPNKIIEAKPGSDVVFVGTNNDVNISAYFTQKSIGIEKYFEKFKMNLKYFGSIINFIRENSNDDVKGEKYFKSLDQIMDGSWAGINLAPPSTGLKIKSIDYLRSGKVLICNLNAIDSYLLYYFRDNIVIINNDADFIDIKLAFDNYDSSKMLKKYQEISLKIHNLNKNKINEFCNRFSDI